MNKDVKNISDLPSATDPVNIGNGPVDVVFKEDVLYLPVEHDEDLRREAEIAAQTQTLRTEGYRLFLDGADVDAIAKKLSIKPSVVLFWAKDGDWAGRIKKHNDASEELVRESVRRIRIDSAEEEAKDSLDISKRIRKEVKRQLEEDEQQPSSDRRRLTPLGVKNLADAAKAAGDLGAHGMGESVGTAGSGGIGGVGNGKTPLVYVFAGGIPPMRKVEEEK